MQWLSEATGDISQKTARRFRAFQSRCKDLAGLNTDIHFFTTTDTFATQNRQYWYQNDHRSRPISTVKFPFVSDTSIVSSCAW